MYKPLTILFLFFSVCYYSLAQQYLPLPTQDGRWCIEYNNHVIPPPPWWYTNYWEKTYDGDTIIQDTTYKKILKTEYSIYCLTQIIDGPEYVGAIRDDTIAKKVYFVPPGQSNEELIYDFSLREGDTLYSYLNYYYPLLIESFDSILIGNTYYRTLCFPYGEGCLIEGVGSATGLLEELTAFEGGSNLCAMYQDSVLLYPQYPCNLSFTDTCLSVGISSNSIEQNEFSIYPNPANSIIHFLHSSGTHSSIIIYDQFGRTIEEIVIPKGQENTTIDLSSYNNGIFIAVWNSKNKVLGREKFIVLK